MHCPFYEELIRNVTITVIVTFWTTVGVRVIKAFESKNATNSIGQLLLNEI